MVWVVLCAHTNLNILRIIQYYQKTYAYTQASHPLYHIRRKRKKRLDSYAYFFVLLGVMRKGKIMGWINLSGLKDKKKILSLLDSWPKLKKSFYNDYNGDFSNIIFSVSGCSVMMYPKGSL